MPEIAGHISRIAPDNVSRLKTLLDEPEANWHTTCMLLRNSGAAEARDIIIERLRQGVDHGREASVLASALGRYQDPTAVQATVSLRERAELFLAAIFVLEDQALPEARDTLPRVEHIQADRALARLGDRRCLDRLVQAVNSSNPDLQREGLEGLRELADPDTSDLIANVTRRHPPESDEAAICAHILVLINDSATTIDAIAELQEKSDDPNLAHVTGSWTSQLATTQGR